MRGGDERHDENILEREHISIEKYFANAHNISMLNGKVDYHEYIRSEGWEKKRQEALARAGNHCQVCRNVNRLEVHHNTYTTLGNETPFDLVVLCSECHGLFHEKLDPRKRLKNPSTPVAVPEWKQKLIEKRTKWKKSRRQRRKAGPGMPLNVLDDESRRRAKRTGW